MFSWYWYAFWLRVAYLFRLRWPAIWFQRWFKHELNAPRKPLPNFQTPQQIVNYAKVRFHYRKDTGRIGGWIFPLDWISDPEVFQARLQDTKTKADGDCDDYHYWAAAALHKMREVDRLYLLSTGFKGGGHATVVYRYRDEWYQLDYQIYKIANPNVAPKQVATRYSDGRVYFWLFETYEPPWRAVAISPKKLKV